MSGSAEVGRQRELTGGEILTLLTDHGRGLHVEAHARCTLCTIGQLTAESPAIHESLPEGAPGAD